MPHPPAEDLVEPRNHVGVKAGRAAQQSLNLLGEFRGQPLVRVEIQYPVRGALVERGVDLRAVALPAL